MLGLDADLKRLVDEARGCDDPAAADRARVTRALAARLGAGALAGAAAATTTAPVAAATTQATATALGGSAVRTAAMAGLGSGAKLAGVLALAGTLGLGASVAMRSRHTRAHEERPTATTRSAVPARLPAPLPAVARETSVLEEEVHLLRDAQQALREARPARALALVDEHARRFPQGLLRQERIAVRVLALCALGRTGQARRESEGFLREWPASPFSRQIRASCGDSRR